MSRKQRKASLSVFLAKEAIQSHTELYKDDPAWRVEEIQMDTQSNGWLISKRPRPNPPKWADFFSGFTDKSKLGSNSSTGALFIVKQSDRFFVLSFGVGHPSDQT